MTLNYFEKFSKAYSDGLLYNLGGGYYTPNMINTAMKNINTNPQAPDSVLQIEKVLNNPKSNEEILRNYAVYFELNNHFYKRLIDFNANLLAWNLTFDCTNIDSPDDFDSKEFQEDLKIIDNFCSKVNFQRDFRTIVGQILRQGVYYGVFRDESDKYAFQELAPNYCKITGRSNYGYLFSFDFSYFINTIGNDINMFPKIFKKLLKQIYEQISTKYNPSGKVDTRHSSFIYTIDLSPRDNFWCFTLDNGITTLIPYYSALFPDMYLQPMMRDLEKNKAMISAQKLLLGILETQDNSKSGAVSNQVKITPEMMGKFLALARSALDKSIGITTLPVREAEVVDFNVENQNRYTNYLRNIAANSVSSSASMLTENKLNAFESELSLIIDENFVKSLYGQFENFIEYYVNNHTKKFKFKFKFNDTNTKTDYKKRNDQFNDMSQKGLVDINLYARATNQTIFEAQRALQFTKTLKLDTLLTSLTSLNNQSNKVGKPAQPDSTNDNTVASNERGSNDLANSE